MPVTKYRSVEEMPGAPFRTPLDPDNLRLACDLSEIARVLHPRVLRAGVTKYRSANEKQTDATRVTRTRSGKHR